jgi:hypothetical protein
MQHHSTRREHTRTCWTPWGRVSTTWPDRRLAAQSRMVQCCHGVECDETWSCQQASVASVGRPGQTALPHPPYSLGRSSSSAQSSWCCTHLAVRQAAHSRHRAAVTRCATMPSNCVSRQREANRSLNWACAAGDKSDELVSTRRCTTFVWQTCSQRGVQIGASFQICPRAAESCEGAAATARMRGPTCRVVKYRRGVSGCRCHPRHQPATAAATALEDRTLRALAASDVAAAPKTP